MPELPEVETVRRGLDDVLLGKKITAVDAEGVALLRRPQQPKRLVEALLGKTFCTTRRRGKYLLLDLEGGGGLLVHLGMSGRVGWINAKEPREKHTHFVLGFKDTAEELRLVDPRRFGMVVWLAPGAEATDTSLVSLGIEPLSRGFLGKFVALLKQDHRDLKTVLMDQSLVAGLGNIYVCEALWRAKLNPTQNANTVTAGRLNALGKEIQGVLGEAITRGGTTLKDHRTVMGDTGTFSDVLGVYGREGQPCGRCGAEIQRAMMGGRATFWCGGCQ
jgi:formamidopyrimidine-DNA glycosylase